MQGSNHERCLWKRLVEVVYAVINHLEGRVSLVLRVTVYFLAECTPTSKHLTPNRHNGCIGDMVLGDGDIRVGRERGIAAWRLIVRAARSHVVLAIQCCLPASIVKPAQRRVVHVFIQSIGGVWCPFISTNTRCENRVNGRISRAVGNGGVGPFGSLAEMASDRPTCTYVDRCDYKRCHHHNINNTVAARRRTAVNGGDVHLRRSKSP